MMSDQATDNFILIDESYNIAFRPIARLSNCWAPLVGTYLIMTCLTLTGLVCQVSL